MDSSDKRLLKENERLFKITEFERRLAAQGYKLIGGGDEVGRGPLAGPVVCCIVILPAGFTYPGINDSKKVSEKKREALSSVITGNAVACAIGEADVSEIDDINILQATKLSFKRAFDSIVPKPDFLLLDAVDIPGITVPQNGIVKGDMKSISIAAASIAAKVYRDRLMCELHEKYPEYAFNENKGYGTPKHMEAIKKYGLSPVHRKTFCRNFVSLDR